MAIKQNKLNANDEVVVSDDLKMTDGVPNNSDVAALFTSANTSLVAVCREYGGTQIKQDENGNFYYEVEVED